MLSGFFKVCRSYSRTADFEQLHITLSAVLHMHGSVQSAILDENIKLSPIIKQLDVADVILLPPFEFLLGRPFFWPLCPASRRHLGRDASCPVFTARRNARIASAVLAMAFPSVWPSVCLSHASIVSKRRHVARCSLHCQIAKCV